MKQDQLSPSEQNIMRITFNTVMLRAADIIDGITENDVVDAQAQMLAEGKTLEQVSRIDRAMLAACHLRACAKGKVKP